MNDKPIGVFDSGLGGLTAVKQLLTLLPGESIVYFGDTGRVPYGSRSKEILRKYAAQDMRFLLGKDVKMVIAACGTISSVAADIGEALCVPFTGVVAPAARAAAQCSESGRIGVIGTAATISSGAYRRTLHSLRPDCEIIEQSCPLFVPLVESGFTRRDDPVTRMVVERYLAPVKAQQIDTLILGCTHYPIIADIIQDFMGEHVRLIDTGEEAAKEAKALLAQNGLLNTSDSGGQHTFFVSDKVEGFTRLGSLFLGREMDGQVCHVDLDSL